MTAPNPLSDRLRGWLQPVVYLSNNVLSLAGVVLMIGLTMTWPARSAFAEAVERATAESVPAAG